MLQLKLDQETGEVKTIMSWHHLPKTNVKEKPRQKSMVIPNPTLSLRDLMERYTSGQTIAVKDGQYQYVENQTLQDIANDNSLPEFDRMQKIEKMEYLHELAKHNRELRNTVNERRKSITKTIKQKKAKYVSDLEKAAKAAKTTDQTK